MKTGRLAISIDGKSLEGFRCASDPGSKPVKIGSPFFTSPGLPRGNLLVACFIARAKLRCTQIR
jgi:hypothetical protein